MNYIRLSLFNTSLSARARTKYVREIV